MTTTFPRHAPEAEYLTDEVSVVSDRNAPALADAMVALVTDQQARDDAEARYELGGTLTVEAMAQAFATECAGPPASGNPSTATRAAQSRDAGATHARNRDWS